jgi:hypothetical protein
MLSILLQEGNFLSKLIKIIYLILSNSHRLNKEVKIKLFHHEMVYKLKKTIGWISVVKKNDKVKYVI